MSAPAQPETRHRLVFGDAKDLSCIKSNSVNLAVTSPPYPMIQMWDEIFSKQDGNIEKELARGRGSSAFRLMHCVLDQVWDEVDRVLVPGGICCINVGDATRTIDGQFALYPNHQRIQQKFLDLGHICLPNIIWRKVTNAPNKFMGSGMMPPSAYVTLEHEWILIFRKGGKRKFHSINEKSNRLSSSYFWEERNIWFSDVWLLPGRSQTRNGTSVRPRSAAYPFEVPYRLINMFSVKHDTVLDPFLGTGTTTFAAIAAERNSIGNDIDKSLRDIIFSQFTNERIEMLNKHINQRIEKHKNFVSDCSKSLKHENSNHSLAVVSSQEEEICLNEIESVRLSEDQVTVSYANQTSLIPVISESNSTNNEPSFLAL